MVVQCSNLSADRDVGKFWEREFCRMAHDFGFMFTPMQIGRNTSAAAYKNESKRWNVYTLPDVTVWTFPGQHHEIKHKNPTRNGTFGLEVYRFDALVAFAEETRQDVLYTIHNHDLAGGRRIRENHISHWITARTDALVGNASLSWGDSWVDGQKKRVRIYYWPISFWSPLLDYWQGCKVIGDRE